MHQACLGRDFREELWGLERRHTPDQGRRPCRPFDSGRSANILIQNGTRLRRVASENMERASVTLQPKGSKKHGPSSGANRKGAFAASSRAPNCFCIIASKPGEARSVIHPEKLGDAERSRARSPA